MMGAAIDWCPTPRISGKRAELRAGLAFLEGSGSVGWGLAGLRGWFQEHLVETGSMAQPMVVTEPPVGTALLWGTGAHSPEGRAKLPEILWTARGRVLGALRGLLSSTADDRFLSAAIFAGRARRTRSEGVNHWVAQPEPGAPLSAIVLSLFAVDVLSYREVYDRCLSVCDVCEQVTFQQNDLHRRRCPEHARERIEPSPRMTLPWANRR